MVHAFQFDLTGEDPRESTGQAPGILAYPLWFVEGMADSRLGRSMSDRHVDA